MREVALRNNWKHWQEDRVDNDEQLLVGEFRKFMIYNDFSDETINKLLTREEINKARKYNISRRKYLRGL